MKGKHKKAEGGRINMKVSGNPDVFKEAEDKHGTERKRGGRVKMKVEGGHPIHRADRPGRKVGGRVGADRSPLSSAHGSMSGPGPGPATQEGGMSK